MSARIEKSIEQIIQLSLESVNQTSGPDSTPSSVEAEDLADELCMLCIEFGIDFHEFTGTVMAEVLDPGRADSAKSSGGDRFPSLGRFPQHRSLLLFALEFMPD